MAFTDGLRPAAETFWSAILAHPTVEQLVDAALDSDPGSQPRVGSGDPGGDGRW